MTLADPSQPLRDAVRIVFRHKRKAVTSALAILAATALITLISPRAYRSQAKLFVRLGRENATLDPTATVGQGPVVAVPQSRETELITAVEILKSRVLVEKVVDAIGPPAILGESPSSDEIGQRYRAVIKLTKLLDVEPVKKSNVLAITYDGATPELAQAVVAKLLDFYLERHMQLSRTPGAAQFLTEQTARQKAELTKVEEQLRDLKTGAGLIAPEVQRQLLMTRIGRLQDDLLQATAGLAAAEAEAKLLRDKRAGLAPTQVTARVKGARNEAADNMRGQLYALRLRELELRQKYPAGHPEIEKVRKQADDAEQLLRKEATDREQVTEGPNRLYEETELALLREEPIVIALRAKADAVKVQLEEQRVELKTLNDNGLRVARLERDQQQQESLYRRYADNLAQAEVDRAMEAERISNISVVQPATLEIEPVRPKALINFAIGLVLALAVGLGVPFLAERLDRSVKTPADVETHFGLPVLGTVPLTYARPAAVNGIEVLP
jgi:uncharacterized protein involved in exopolysaccharide biosynthesis